MTLRDMRAELLWGISAVPWLLMGRFWLQEDKLLALLFAFATVALNFAVFFFIRYSFYEIAGTIATNAWVLQDVVWMLGDLELVPPHPKLAVFFSNLAILALGAAIARSPLSKKWYEALAGFGRLRLSDASEPEQPESPPRQYYEKAASADAATQYEKTCAACQKADIASHLL